MSHPQARPPVRARHLPRQKPEHAFTLVELLAVIAIIGILCAITFGIVKGVNERAAIGQAKSELAVLAQALEGYKRQYGDYPQTGSGDVAVTATVAAGDVQASLFNALAGQLGPTLSTIAGGGKAFVDTSKFTLQSATAMPTSTSGPVANAFLDPWGRLYMYYYRAVGTTTPWKSSSYVLCSVGPDGLITAPTTAGDPQITAANNVDNIYANKN